jgi:hypothetical protein
VHTSPNLVTWRKTTRQDRTGQDRIRQDKTGQDKTGHDKTRRDGIGQDKKTASNVTQRLTVFTAALVKTKQNSFLFYNFSFLFTSFH